MVFEITFSNGARNLIDVKSMTRAKRIASQLLTSLSGNVYVENLQTGETWWRCFWRAGDRIGWYQWVRLDKPEKLYHGFVVDRLNGKVVYRSRPSTWAEAQTKAERKARSLGCGERFGIKVRMEAANGTR